MDFRADETFKVLFEEAKQPKEICIFYQHRLRDVLYELNDWQFLHAVFIVLQKSCSTDDNPSSNSDTSMSGFWTHTQTRFLQD